MKTLFSLSWPLTLHHISCCRNKYFFLKSLQHFEQTRKAIQVKTKYINWFLYFYFSRWTLTPKQLLSSPAHVHSAALFWASHCLGWRPDDAGTRCRAPPPPHTHIPFSFSHHSISLYPLSIHHTFLSLALHTLFIHTSVIRLPEEAYPLDQEPLMCERSPNSSAEWN